MFDQKSSFDRTFWKLDYSEAMHVMKLLRKEHFKNAENHLFLNMY